MVQLAEQPDGTDSSGSGGGFNPPPPPDPTTPPNAAGAADNPANITATGGLVGYATNVLIPMFSPQSKRFFFALFDPIDFNTEIDCEHHYRQEEIMTGHQITVSRVRMVYRNLGLCFLRATIFTDQHQSEIDILDEDGDPQVGGNSEEKQFGTRVPDFKLKTDYFDICVTGERPQLVLTRLANNGPISIISTQLMTNVEIAEQI